MTQFLDFNEMAKSVAKSANRALSLLIVKSKAHGGFQYSTFTKLFDTLVWPVISYGSAIWGTRNFSCIDAIQNRAIRFFLGVGKYTPNDAINGDMGWKPPSAKLWVSVFRQWKRFTVMDRDRVNFKVFNWSLNFDKKNWCYRVKEKLKENNHEFFTNIDNILSKQCILNLESILFEKYKNEWKNRILAQGIGKKLRTYKLFKSSYGTEKYLSYYIPYKYRSALAKFRCGVAPLRIETGRFERKKVEERVCFHCNNVVEDEKHVVLTCPLYADLRFNLYDEISKCDSNFNLLSDDDKFIYLFNTDVCLNNVAKTCFYILSRRNTFLYS